MFAAFNETSDLPVNSFPVQDIFYKFFRVEREDGNIKLCFQRVKAHSVKKNRLVRFNRVFRNKDKIADDFIFHRQKILSRQKPCNGDIATEICVWNG